MIIGEKTYLDYGVIVRNSVDLIGHRKIGARCILGEYLVDFFQEKEYGIQPLVIGGNALI